MQPVAAVATADETLLVSRARTGDRRAFEELVTCHTDGIYRVAYGILRNSHDAEEVTQEVFLRAWRAIAGFEGRARFFTWLYRIAVNEARRRMERIAATESLASVDDLRAQEIPDTSAAPEELAERTEAKAGLERAVRALPWDYRAPLILRDVEGLSTQEAAAVMDLGEAAFKSRLHRARMTVRQALDDEAAG